ncbi:hypothetical protein QTJ04_00560 [Clostridium perfringens]|uniref:hypothetical protein n=1 Tax=Clostridium perfringens TaxID=1502 RepID=UPI0013E28F54|nr:hypothetical protein [Clostridium perfringens]MCX0411191.1 hypothetical protein [Clostridium perfringens]MDM1004734.1 hypothetical protein [Clostridium perfringens]MDU5248708.1 hypothetical protein [Clostridium perfringens]NGT85359.1 hypothetical protein [Clostridium perfringens]BDA34223.1 hypothetical protein CPBEC5_12310 [Clostridium perfringens]
MGDSNKNIKRELNLALKNAIHAQEYINLALNTVEKNENKQLIQNTLNNINKSVDMTKTSFYVFKE